METRLKVKGVPQGIPTTPFVEEVSETLPPTQGTYPTLRKQQLVEEFPESRFPLPSKTTQFHVSTEELKHPVPIHNLTSPKSPKPESSASTQADDLVKAIKKLGKMKSDAGKLREPELFTGKDPKKLKAFIFQCQLYFRKSDFDSDSKKVTFALSYLRDVAQEWFEPGISGLTGLTDEPLEWSDNWEAFLDELRTNFGPYDETGDAEHELTSLRMRDSQRVSDYLVHFSGLALHCSWGEPALRYRFYKGLPSRIKDELSKSEKPRTLQVLKQKVQNIDARYWERTQERSCEQQYRQNLPKSSTSSASAVPSTTPKSTPRPDFRSEQKPKLKNSKQTTLHVDLSGKLDSKGKLTQQERQCQINKNLCLFCRGSRHRTNTCPVKSARGCAATAESVPTLSKSKESGTSSKKD
jgi:Retrotransposon gag protein